MGNVVDRLSLNEAMEEDVMQRKSISRFFPWFIFALGAAFYSYEYFLRIMPGALELDLRHYFNNINADKFGFLNGVYYYAYVPMQLVVGLLMDRYGPKRLLTFACFFCVVGAYLFIAIPSIPLASAGRFLVGFGSAFAFAGVLKLASIWLPENRFALFVGLASALGAIGAVFGHVALEHLFEYVSWYSAIIGTVILGLVLTIVLYHYVEDTNPDAKPGSLSFQAQQKTSTLLEAISHLKSILLSVQFWLAGFVGCLVYLPTTVFAEMWGIPFLQGARGYPTTVATLGVSMIFLGFALGAPFMGYISDKFRTRKWLLFIGSLMATAFMLAIIYVPQLSVVTLYVLLFCLGFSYSNQALVFAIARDISPKQATATAVASTNMLVMLGGIFLQPIVGLLLERFWSGQVAGNLHIYSLADYQKAFLAIPICMVLSSILSIFISDAFLKKGKTSIEFN